MKFQPAIYDRVLSAYEALGLGRESVGLWCTPLRDAEVLIEHLDPSHHRCILEVGTYVGVSALLMALHAPESRIHTVDPNLPLQLGTPGRGVEGMPAAGQRTLAIAAQAAARLGVADRVAFYAGGFAVAGDFESRIGGRPRPPAAEPSSLVPREASPARRRSAQPKGDAASRAATAPRRVLRLVGPTLCRREGPFDAVFIDGLHYHDAVQEDLELISSHLAPGGVIILHDLIGLWGAHLRWAVHRFLERHPEFLLRHEPYREIYHAIGSLSRRSDAGAAHLAALRSRPVGARLLDDPRWQRQLLAAAWRERTKGPLIELRLAVAPSLSREALAIGAREAHEVLVEPGSIDAALKRLSRLPPKRTELLLLLGTLDGLDDDEAAALLSAVAARAGTTLLGLTPPGERGAAQLHSRTLPSNFALLRAAGLRSVNDLTLDLEPFLLPYWSGVARQSSHLLHLITVAKRSRKVALADTGLSTAVPRGADDAAAAIESRQLGILFRDLLMQHVLGKSPPAAPPPEADTQERGDGGGTAEKPEQHRGRTKRRGRKGKTKGRRSRARSR
jgi:SAM-dependent methyltransferase